MFPIFILFYPGCNSFKELFWKAGYFVFVYQPCDDYKILNQQSFEDKTVLFYLTNVVKWMVKAHVKQKKVYTWYFYKVF